MPIEQLKPGMKIDHPVVDRLDKILVARGVTLDRHMIDAILRRGIANVYIQVDEDLDESVQISPAAQENIDKLRTEDRAKVTLSASVRKRVSEGIQYIYIPTPRTLRSSRRPITLPTASCLPFRQTMRWQSISAA